MAKIHEIGIQDEMFRIFFNAWAIKRKSIIYKKSLEKVATLSKKSLEKVVV